MVARRVPVTLTAYSPENENVIYYTPMKRSAKRCKKPFREWLLNLCGYEIWPPTHNDPRIQGPQPRILTKRQWEAMEMLRRERENDGVDSVVRNDRE